MSGQVAAAVPAAKPGVCGFESEVVLLRLSANSLQWYTIHPAASPGWGVLASQPCTCVKPRRKPSFLLSLPAGMLPTYCAECKLEGMVNVNIAM